ncbi:RAD protein (Pv-fam-e) [Plasmodium ovale wallikeri]|uniref:RAD protein (Pv-fam-e) n=1 Tax=Plasmodium ovale wallikeri TaxID=864142 RepID=A0A1A9AQ05_PLAOA|nr:RAD protein (Pv-fam-e) [Plasmodium ovale wallikeri]SBT58295.1 RAD protein (Pv-fam-e) [Plasmodium ovale wallikeri]
MFFKEFYHFINNVCVDETSKLSEVSCGYNFSRQLAEAAVEIKTTIASSNSNVKENSTHESEISNNLPFGCEESDLSKVLKKEEIDKLIESYGPVATEKELYIAFYYYNKHLNNVFNKMMKTLLERYETYALRCNVPHETRMKYLLACEDGLTNDLKIMNHYAFEYLATYLENEQEHRTIKFKLFLSLHNWTWNKEMQESERKWSKYFVQKIRHKSRKHHHRRDHPGKEPSGKEQSGKEQSEKEQSGKQL